MGQGPRSGLEEQGGRTFQHFCKNGNAELAKVAARGQTEIRIGSNPQDITSNAATPKYPPIFDNT